MNRVIARVHCTCDHVSDHVSDKPTAPIRQFSDDFLNACLSLSHLQSLSMYMSVVGAGRVFLLCRYFINYAGRLVNKSNGPFTFMNI